MPAGSHLFLDLEFQILLSCVAFFESYRSQGRNRKDYCRNAQIIRLFFIPLQQVRRYDDAVIACDGSERRASTRSSVARCKHRRIRYTLQESLDLYTPPFPFDSCSIQVHVLPFRYTTARLDDHASLTRALLPITPGP